MVSQSITPGTKDAMTGIADMNGLYTVSFLDEVICDHREEANQTPQIRCFAITILSPTLSLDYSCLTTQLMALPTWRLLLSML